MTSLSLGFNFAEVTCSAPRYVTLHIASKDSTLAPLLVPLDPAGAGRYKKSFTLTGEVGKAWLESMPPGATEDLLSVSLRGGNWIDLAATAWRAMRRHAGSPGILLSKARQVVGSNASLVFSGGGDGSQDCDVHYLRWQEAFESEQELDRVIEALRERLGERRVRVLGVVSAWPHGPEALREALASLSACVGARIDILSLTQEDPRQWVDMPERLASWTHQPSSEELPLGMKVLATAFHRCASDLVLFIEKPGCFHPNAVVSLALELVLSPSALAVYADHDHLEAGFRRHSPCFKPAWSPEFHANSGYIAQPVAFRGGPDLFSDDMGSVSAGAPAFSILSVLSLRAADGSVVRHVPRVLFHERPCVRSAVGFRRMPSEERDVPTVLEASARECAITGSASGRPVRWTSSATPRATVIIPTKNNPSMLVRACRSVREAEGVAAQTVIVDNGTDIGASHSVVDELATANYADVVRVPGSFNFSCLINAGRVLAKSDILVLLNDDVEALDKIWLQELVSQAGRAEIGAVGALLFYPDGRIQHAGIVLGINGGAGHAFRFARIADAECDMRLKVPHEVSAVTGACLAVRTSVFDEVGGFEQDLPVTLNDVDFCLKLRRHGYRNIVSPYARLTHSESTTRGLDITPDRLLRLSQETAIFRRRWGVEAVVDPYYSPHLSPTHEDFRLRAL